MLPQKDLHSTVETRCCALYLSLLNVQILNGLHGTRVPSICRYRFNHRTRTMVPASFRNSDHPSAQLVAYALHNGRSLHLRLRVATIKSQGQMCPVRHRQASSEQPTRPCSRQRRSLIGRHRTSVVAFSRVDMTSRRTGAAAAQSRSRRRTAHLHSAERPTQMRLTDCGSFPTPRNASVLGKNIE